MYTFLFRFCRSTRDSIAQFCFLKKLVNSLITAMKLSKDRISNNRGHLKKSFVQPQVHFHLPGRGQGHHGGHQQPLGWFFSLVAHFFFKKVRVLGPKTTFGAKKTVQNKCQKRPMTMSMGSVPQGLGPHLCHEEVGWRKTILKLKICIFFIK